MWVPMATTKLGLEFPSWNCFFIFLLVSTNKKGIKEEEKLVCILKMKESAWKKNQSNLIGLLVDSLNYEPHSHVLPYSETHWGQILSSNRIWILMLLWDIFITYSIEEKSHEFIWNKYSNATLKWNWPTILQWRWWRAEDFFWWCVTTLIWP